MAVEAVSRFGLDEHQLGHLLLETRCHGHADRPVFGEAFVEGQEVRALVVAVVRLRTASEGFAQGLEAEAGGESACWSRAVDQASSRVLQDVRRLRGL